MNVHRTRWPLAGLLVLLVAAGGCRVDWLDAFDVDGAGGERSDHTAEVDDTDVPGLDVALSDDRFARTYDNLQQAIGARGNDNALAVDLQAKADTAGRDIRPTRVILYGDPGRTTPIIAADRRAGLDLPPAILVYQTDDDDTNDNNVGVAYNSGDYLAARYDAADARDALDGLADDLSGLAADAAGNAVSRSGDAADISRHQGIVDRTSDQDFETTLDNLVGAIRDDDDLELLGQFDHRQAAHRIGSMLDANDDPATLVVFDGGAAQARAIAGGQTVAVDLPLRILVSRDTEGRVHLYYSRPDYLADRHDLEAADAIGDLDDILGDLVDKVAD